MRKLIFFKCLPLLLLLLAGCHEQQKVKYKKPWVIIDKCINCGTNNYTLYHYIDKNGNRESFTETENAYKIGDTIK